VLRIKAEGELVEAVVEVLLADAALMRAQAPALEERGDAVPPGLGHGRALEARGIDVLDLPEADAADLALVHLDGDGDDRPVDGPAVL
jgi:hypothetical protein